MTVIVRRADPADTVTLLALVKALARFEREPDAVKATEASLHATLFGDGAQVFAHVAELGGRPVGGAIWFLTFSTWTGQPSLYLEDIFVDEAARGQGVGHAIFCALAREARERGCARMDWAVLDWNEQAMGFYRTLGARQAEGWQPWRLEGAALDRLAAE